MSNAEKLLQKMGSFVLLLSTFKNCQKKSSFSINAECVAFSC